LVQIQSATSEQSKLFSRYAAHLSPYIVNPLRCSAFGAAVVVGWRVSLLFEASETRMPRLRNFDTEPPSSYCYEAQPEHRLKSVANAHTAADLHVRPVS
jgi:hypothetical protein